jgi:hypothetical protein
MSVFDVMDLSNAKVEYANFALLLQDAFQNFGSASPQARTPTVR